MDSLRLLHQQRSEKEILEELRRTVDPEKKIALLKELTALKQSSLPEN
jgi:hypothetical protein